MDIRIASGPHATEPGAKEEACERSEAGGRIPYAPPGKRNGHLAVPFFMFTLKKGNHERVPMYLHNRLHAHISYIESV